MIYDDQPVVTQGRNPYNTRTLNLSLNRLVSIDTLPVGLPLSGLWNRTPLLNLLDPNKRTLFTPNLFRPPSGYLVGILRDIQNSSLDPITNLQSLLLKGHKFFLERLQF